MRPIPRLPRAILFDNDGVLIQSEPLHWAAWTRMLRELGLPVETSELQALVGRTAPQILRHLLDRHRPGWTESEFDLDAIALKKNDLYLLEVPKSLRLYPGVREGLEWLRSQGVKTAIVTNAKRRELEASVEALGTRPLFDALVSRDDVSEPKPSPLPYLTAAALCGVEIQEAFVLEDSPPGLTAGLLAGAECVGIGHHLPKEQLERPVPGRPDLKAGHYFTEIAHFFSWLQRLPNV